MSLKKFVTRILNRKKYCMRRFFVEHSPFSDDLYAISGTEARHIKTVLRMQPGDFVELVDGSGYAYTAEITKITDTEVLVQVHERYPTGAESHIRLTMAIGFLKEKKMDLLVRHLTELGIGKFLPMITARSIARPPEKRMISRVERWQTIAREAVKQSQRGRIPEIARPASFEEALELSHHADNKFIFWENADAALPAPDATATDSTDVFVMIGPEGGFTEKEAMAAADKGFTPLSMGPRMLRAETAAISACTLIQYLYGDIRKKSP